MGLFLLLKESVCLREDEGAVRSTVRETGKESDMFCDVSLVRKYMVWEPSVRFEREQEAFSSFSSKVLSSGVQEVQESEVESTWYSRERMGERVSERVAV